jgi:hypothetical protein
VGGRVDEFRGLVGVCGAGGWTRGGEVSFAVNGGRGRRERTAARQKRMRATWRVEAARWEPTATRQKRTRAVWRRVGPRVDGSRGLVGMCGAGGWARRGGDSFAVNGGRG